LRVSFHAHAAEARESDDVEDVFCGGCAGDDIAWERFSGEVALEFGDSAEGVEDFGA
jgi:hypothetical protein